GFHLLRAGDEATRTGFGHHERLEDGASYRGRPMRVPVLRSIHSVLRNRVREMLPQRFPAKTDSVFGLLTRIPLCGAELKRVIMYPDSGTQVRQHTSER